MLNTTIFDRYAIEEQIGASDLFIEYRGKDAQTNKPVMASVVKPKIVPAADFLSRFEPLTKTIARVESSHVVKVLDYGELDGQAVIVRESVEGKTLASMIAGGNGLPLDLVLDITRQLGEYLDALHKHGVIQVVFDPEDVMLSAESEIRVLNLGLAQGLNVGELLSKGKLKAAAYHAPELLRGEQGDARTDFYSLGVLLFTALTGKQPDAKAAAGKTPTMADFYPSRLCPGLPPELDELVAKCLHPDPNRRIQSAAEFLDGLEQVRSGMAAGAGDTILGIEDSLVGQTLGAYRLVERLGQGGMATVYKAYEPALGRYVAIKVLPQFFARDPNFLKRFRREAKAVAQLSHPNIVPIHSYGEEGDVIYIAMQFVEGGTLKHGKEKVFTSEEALRLLLPITRALGYAHARGIIHRDIKPSNVLLSEGNWPLLADFGLAQIAEASTKLTGTGVGMGTPAYMSPEQGRGDKVDARTDIYSLGIMLYEMVTGDVPFHADTPMAIVIKHLTAPMPIPRKVNPNIPKEVEEIILKATAKSPDDRFQTAEEMIAAMEKALNRLTAPKERLAPKEKVKVEKPSRKEKAKVEKPALRLKPLPLAAIAAVVILAVLAGVFAPRLIASLAPAPTSIATVTASATATIPPATKTPTPTPTITETTQGATLVPTPLIIGGTLGPILFQDDFEGQISPRWEFYSAYDLAPSWEAIEMDGRTVMHSLPPSSKSDIYYAEIHITEVNFAVQFDFFFLKPSEYGHNNLYFDGRLTTCPPDIPSEQSYVLFIYPALSGLTKSICSGTGFQNLITYEGWKIDPEIWHTLEIMFIGNRIRILIDSEGLFDYIDNDGPYITDGGIRIRRLGNEILIDNFKVYEVIPAH